MPPKTNHKKERKLITNAEVLEALKLQTPAVKRNRKKGSTHYEWIREHVSDYLCQFESSNPTRPELFAVLPDTLTQEEKLQIVNIVPTELVELFLIIDNLNDRFTESQQEQLLALILQVTNKPHDVVEREETFIDVTMEPMDIESEPYPTNDSMDADSTPTSQVTPDPVTSGSPMEDDMDVMTPMHATLGAKQMKAKYVVNGAPLPSILETA